MKNISFNLNDITAKFRQNVGLSLWAGLILLILLVGLLVVRHSIGTLFAVKQVTQTPQTQLVRINFGLYDGIAKRFEAVGSFLPSQVTVQNPFGTLEAKPAVKK
jgi:hypothetical protein